MVKLLLAGAEGHLKELKQVGVENILLSYNSMKEKKTMKEFRDSFKFIFLDSGAYTFLRQRAVIREGKAVKKKKKIDLKEIEQYFFDYLKWAKQNRNYFDACAELDLYRYAGGEKVTEWRQKMVEENLPVVPVYHFESSPFKLFTQFCEDFNYVGVGGQYRKIINLILLKVKKTNRKLHIFGFTDIELLRKFGGRMPFSVDSTTWLAGGQFGETFYFDGFRMMTCSKTARIRFVRQIEEIGLDRNKWLSDDGKTVNSWNARQFYLYEKYLNKRFHLGKEE